jgi:hypothetical protein
MEITDFYNQSSVLIVAGKGGVGKTTVSVALARLAAHHGVSVLLIELEGKSGLSAALGHHRLTRFEVELSAPGSGSGRSRSAPIRARMLTPHDVLAEYLIDHGLRRVARHLAKSGTLDVMATAVPGLRPPRKGTAPRHHIADVADVKDKNEQKDSAVEADWRRPVGEANRQRDAHQRPGRE